MATEIGTAYLKIQPSAQGMAKSLQSIVEPEADRAGSNAGKTFGAKFGSSLQSAGKAFTSFTASGAAAIAGLTASISNSAVSGGLSRALQIDEAMAKFRQLGFDADAMSESIVAGLGESRYALNEATATAVNFASAGIKQGKQMEAAIASVASVASISGREFSDIGNIYTKVAATGKLTGEVMAQLQENGINANAALQKSLGKSSAEISAMVSSGQIDFETFSNAMTEYFGDAGDSAMTTFSGALMNTQTVLNRVAANFAGPALEAVRRFFAGDEGKEGLYAALLKIEEMLGPTIEKFEALSEKVGTRLVGSIDTFNKTLDSTGSIAEAAKAAISELIPDSIKQKWESLDLGTQQLITSFGKFFGIIAGGAAIWGTLTGGLSALIPGFGALLGPLAGAGGAFKIVKTLGTSVVDIFTAMSGTTAGLTSPIGRLIGTLGKLGGPFAFAVTAFTLMMTKSEKFRSAVMGLVQAIAAGVMPIVQAVMPYIQMAMDAVGQIAAAIGDALAPAIQTVSPIIAGVGAMIGNIITTIFPAVKFAITVIVNLIQVLAGIVGTVFGTIRNVITTVWTNISTTTLTVWNAIKAAVSNPMNFIVGIIKTGIAKIKNIWNTLSELVGRAKTTFDNAKAAILGPIQTARDKVKGIIDKIKGFFSFKVSLPNIPLPYFAVDPPGWKLSDLLKGTIPSLRIDWHAKGAIFTQPTVIGSHGFGDAGAEAALPLDPFWNRMDAMADGLLTGMSTVMRAVSGEGIGDIHLDVYLYPSGPKMGETTVKTYDTYKERLG